MHVGFEAIAWGTGMGAGQGGAANYVEGLVPELLADDRVTKLTAYVPGWYEPARRWSHPRLAVHHCHVSTNRPTRVAYEQAVLPLWARSHGVDILFSSNAYRPFAYRRPNVVALHAIQHFLLGDDIGRARSAYMRFAVPRALRTADTAIAVSDTLREDAIRLFALDPERIVTIHMGPSPWTLELRQGDDEGPTPISGPYVLCISRLYALKNHARLIEAFAQVSADLPHQLVIVGGDADVTRAELEAVARAHGVSDRVQFLGRVPQPEVAGLYRGADAVAYVSLYETFGHPVLEAFASRTALITSSAGATAEIAGDAAVLVDPREPTEIATGLRRVLESEDLRAQLVVAGTRRLADFSWARCAEQTVDVLSATLERRR